MTSSAVAQLSAEQKRSLLKRLLDEQFVWPLSAGQRRLWLLQQLAPDSAAYHFPYALRITSRYDTAVLRASLQQLVDRHAVFRTTFVEENGEVVQRVHSGTPVAFDTIDVAGVSMDELNGLVNRQAEQPIDLAAGPVFRCSLFRVDESNAILLLLWHHIVLDVWSLALVLEELGVIHAAISAGASPQLLPMRPYREFVEWQQRLLAGKAGEQQETYWHNALQNAEPLSLPFDAARPVQRQYRGGLLRFTLGDVLTHRIKTLAAELDTTPFVVLLATFQSLLYRVADNDFIAVSFPVNGRTERQFDHTAGLFINQVSVVAQFTDSLTFRELIAVTRQGVLGAIEHQDYHLSLLSQPPSGRGGYDPGAPDVMFVLQKSQGYRLELPNGVLRDNATVDSVQLTAHGELGGLKVSSFPLEANSARFDLELQMIEQGNAFVGWMQYDAEVFSERTVRTLTSSFQRLAEQLTQNVDLRVVEADMLDPRERHQLPSERKDTITEWLGGDNIADLFEQIAASTPKNVAASCGDNELTFGELDARSNRVAQWLRVSGVQPQQIVGLCIPRSLDMLVALLGIVKAGAVYLPLDPATPLERLHFMLADSQAPFVVTSHASCALLNASAARILCLQCDESALQQRDSAPVQRAEAPLLNVIYTSGSSGDPKGVLGTQRGALNRFRWMWEELPFTHDESCAQLTTLNFVDAVWEIFGPLLQGVRVHIIIDDEVRDLERLTRAIETSQATRVTLVPSLLRVLLEHTSFAKRLSAVRFWSCSGEALPATLAARFLEVLPHSRLFNLYGCSEASADSCCFEVTRDWEGDRVPIGKPIANTRVYILDRFAQLVPPGLPGELHIAGAGLAAGYLHRPLLTAERFVDDVLVPGERMYRTGDIGRQLPDGSIEYLGRADRQLKIRGNRVEPGEVEAVIAAHPRVASVAVTGLAESSGDTALVAYIVPLAHTILPHPLDASELLLLLRTHLQERLPAYMVPSRMVLLEAMPLTSSGKLDRRALPPPDVTRNDDRYVAPRTETERLLAAIWQDVLCLSKLSVDADFFEAGGHSILALQAVSRTASQFARPVPVVLLFQRPTIAMFAAYLDADGNAPVAAGDNAPADQISGVRHRIVTVESRGTRPPLFWIPGGAGTLEFSGVKTMLAQLGTDQPVHGLGSRWPERLSEVESVPERAHAYTKIILEAQPDGPFHLAGFCLGGVVAFEVANQLRAAGKQVSFLGMVNSWMPALSVPESQWIALFAQRAVYHARQAFRQDSLPVHRYLWRRLRTAKRVFRREAAAETEQMFVDDAGQQGVAPMRISDSELLVRAAAHLASKYRPSQYDGTVHLYVSRERALEGVSDRLDPRQSWRRVCSATRIVHLPGGHMPEPIALGVAIRQDLERAMLCAHPIVK